MQEALDDRSSGKANLTGMRSIGISAREAQEAQALTCGMIACIDDAIGRVLAALDASGERDNTVVIFTTDHGDHLGDHRLLLKGCEQYQSILHVPFLWSDPQAPAAASTDAIGSTIDIPATILDRARIAPYAGMQGKSLLPAMGPGGKPVRDCALVQYEQQMSDTDTDHMPRWHTIVDARYRMTVMSDSSFRRILRSAKRSRRIRQSLGPARTRRTQGAADGAAASARDRAHRHGAVSHGAGVSGVQSTGLNWVSSMIFRHRSVCVLISAMSWAGPVSPTASMPCRSNFAFTSGSACAFSAAPI